MLRSLLPWCVLVALSGCSSPASPPAPGAATHEELAPARTASASSASAPVIDTDVDNPARQRLDAYARVKLSADLSAFSASQKKMITLLVEAADSMNDLYWQQAWGDRDALLSKITDPATRELVSLTYGP